MMITKLKGHIPDGVLTQLESVMNKFEINTPLRLAHFLSQAAHESGGFKFITENLNYSAAGLKTTFPKYFPGNLNEIYARKPEMIASKVYASRMGNRDEKSRDGWTFRGRGYIQLTGKSNYQEFDNFVDENIIVSPDLVANKYPLLSAGWYFYKNNLNKISDKGDSKAVITELTKRINGGIIGLDDRIEKFNKIYSLLK